jgi:hypothetical protein
MAGGRVRTSTVILTVAFIAVLTLWVSVRPTTASTTEEVLVRHTTTKKTAPVSDEKDQQSPAPRVTPSPTPTATLTPTPAGTVLPKGKKSTAAPTPVNGPGALPIAPPPSPGDSAAPGQTSPPAGSISQILPPGQTPAPPG